jgi:hypothetical protein
MLDQLRTGDHVFKGLRRNATLAALLAVLVVGCDSAQPVSDKPLLAEKVGQNCIVQFRRGDGLGAAGSLPVSATTGSINGAEVSVSGKLRAVSGGWIAVESGSTEYDIPRESILLVQFGR